MLGLNVSYLKYILLGILLYGLILVVNNKLLAGNEQQTDGFEVNKENEAKLDKIVIKLDEFTNKIDGFIEKFETMNGNQDDEDEEDDEDDENDENDEMVVDVENPKKKTESLKKNNKHKKDKKHKAKHLNHNKKPETEGFTNYTTGVASAFGGDYLLLDH